MERVMGKFSDRSRACALDIETRSEEDAGSYVIRLITYVSEPGSRVPACLLLPSLLCLNPASKPSFRAADSIPSAIT